MMMVATGQIINGRRRENAEEDWGECARNVAEVSLANCGVRDREEVDFHTFYRFSLVLSLRSEQKICPQTKDQPHRSF